MSPIPSNATIELVLFLTPGFFATGIYHALTTHPKPSSFERVVHALILSSLINPLVDLVGWMLMTTGSRLNWGFGAWNEIAVTCARQIGKPKPESPTPDEPRRSRSPARTLCVFE